MKKLKIKLLYSLLIILSCSYIIYNILNQRYQSKYDTNTTYIQGKVLSYNINGNTLQLEVKAKEKLILFYQFKTLQEKEKYQKSIKLGNIYDFHGNIELPSTNTNFNLFSYKNYLLSKKIYYVMNIESIKLHEANKSFFYNLKNNLYKFIKTRKTYSYLSLFIFGNNDSLNNNMLQMYRNCGISHLIAISGMHISLFVTILSFLLKWIHSNYIKYGVITTILWIYAFIIGFTPSIMRAVATFTVTIILKLFNKRVHSIYVLIIIAIVFLLYNPFYIYNTGFLFSFIISFFLILSKDIIKKYKYYTTKVFIISLIASLASIPIIANSFYEINLLNPFINILFVPYISFILFPSALITFTIPIFEPIFEIIINISEMMIKFCNHHLTIQFIIPHMNIYVIFIYYIILFLIIYYKNLKYLLVIVIFIIIHSYKKSLIKYPIITMIDVGQGDSILISYPYNKTNILIDTGGKIKYKTENWKEKEIKSLTETTIIPYLKSVGINKLDYLILSHGDYDHMGEAINLVENFKVEKVIFNCGEFNELEQDLIKVLDKKKISYYSCIKELNIYNNKLYFLNNKDYGNENDNSLVIYTELMNYKFLFMGDAGVEVEEDLIEKYNLQDIDVLKVGHHGSKTSSSEEFINSINPEYSIISVGKNNRYGHPNKEVLDNLKESKIYRTDQDGSIMFKIKNNTLKIETCVP